MFNYKFSRTAVQVDRAAVELCMCKDIEFPMAIVRSWGNEIKREFLIQYEQQQTLNLNVLYCFLGLFWLPSSLYSK